MRKYERRRKESVRGRRRMRGKCGGGGGEMMKGKC